jgi:hypothetical protein
MQLLMKALLLVVICLCSAYLYFYYITKNNVDSFIESVSPFVQLKYENFVSRLDGTISIEDVSISMPPYGRLAKIESVDFILDSAYDYFTLDDRLSAGEIIPKLQLKINRLKSSVDLLDVYAKEPDPVEQFINHVGAQGCGDVQSLDMTLLPELGYSELDISMNINFDHSQLERLARFNVDLIAHDMNAVYTTVEIPRVGSMQDFANPEIELGMFKVDVQDLGYNEKVAEFCAVKSDVPVEGYAKHHLEALKSFFTEADIQLSDGIYDAYQSYVAKQATLSLQLQPKNAVNWEHISLYPTNEWPRVLGLSLLVNDEKVDDFAFSWDKEHSLATAIASEKEVTTKQPEQVEQKRKKTFVQISPGQLANYVDSRVKVETRLNKKYEGYVRRSGSDLVVRIKSYGGKMDIQADSQTIAKAFVYK